MAATAAPSAPAFGRARPALALLLILTFIVGHHWWVVTQGEMFPKLLLFLFGAAGWCIGGLLHPPAFYSLTKWGGHLPRSMKILGAVFGLTGMTIGLYLMNLA